MTEEDLYWQTPRPYYISAAFLFAFMIFMILWILLLPAFWDAIDPLFKFIGYIGIFGPAGLGVLMIVLGHNSTGKEEQKG